MRMTALGQGAPAYWQRFLAGMVATMFETAATGSSELTPAAKDGEKAATYKARTCALN